MQFPGVMDMLAKYQAEAPAAGTDALGYYIPPFAYAGVQTLGLAITKAGTTDSDKVAAELRSATFDTVIGKLAFGPVGEWRKERMLQVQYHDIHANTIDELKDMNKVTILAPEEFKSGDLIYPYAAAKK